MQNGKFLPGGEEINVVIMSPEGNLDKMLAESGILKHANLGRLRLVFHEHGLPWKEHTSEHFTNLLELCASNDVTNLTVSDYSCYSAATSRLHGAKIPDGRQSGITCAGNYLHRLRH